MAVTEPGALIGTVPYRRPSRSKDERLIIRRTSLRWVLSSSKWSRGGGHSQVAIPPLSSRTFCERLRHRCRLCAPAVHRHWNGPSAGASRRIERPDGTARRSQATSNGSARDRSTRARRSASATRTRTWTIVAALGAAVAGAIAVWLVKPGDRPLSPSAAQFTVDLPEGVELEPEPTSPTLSFSPDGKQLMFSALKGGDLQIFVRRDRHRRREASGWDGRRRQSALASSDGQWIVFSSKGLLNKVALGGGTPVPLLPPT